MCEGDVRLWSPRYDIAVVVSAVAAGSSLLRYVLRPDVAVIVLARERRVEDIGGG